jgi:hypothetical protein
MGLLLNPRSPHPTNHCNVRNSSKIKFSRLSEQHLQIFCENLVNGKVTIKRVLAHWTKILEIVEALEAENANACWRFTPHEIVTVERIEMQILRQYFSSFKALISVDGVNKLLTLPLDFHKADTTNCHCVQRLSAAAKI